MSNDILVIDMQHHFIPSGAVKLIRKTDEHDFTYGLGRFKKEYQDIQDPGVHLKSMDEAGIDMAVLSTGSFVANGEAFCRVCNDGYSEVCRKYPDRFKGMIHVYPFADKGKNQDEITRCVEELGLWGIAAVTSFQDSTVDAPVMDHIYEMAVKYDMPVFVHPTIRINLWGGERHDLFMTVAREYDIVKSFVEIIYGVLPRFPELKVIMSHFAGGLPVLAHPFTLDLASSQLRVLVRELSEQGLEGIEGYYSEYSTQQQEQYLGLAREFGLVVAGGTDFHGDVNPAIRLGVGFGPLRVPDELLAELFARRDALRAPR